ncbi:hypothetical protein Yalta_157 [Yalta virus]|nr:hypothetical protein Yalta_157 [Yalta virus]
MAVKIICGLIIIITIITNSLETKHISAIKDIKGDMYSDNFNHYTPISDNQTIKTHSYDQNKKNTIIQNKYYTTFASQRQNNNKNNNFQYDNTPIYLNDPDISKKRIDINNNDFIGFDEEIRNQNFIKSLKSNQTISEKYKKSKKYILLNVFIFYVVLYIIIIYVFRLNTHEG